MIIINKYFRLTIEIIKNKTTKKLHALNNCFIKKEKINYNLLCSN